MVEQEMMVVNYLVLLPEGDEPEVLPLQLQQAVQHPDELDDADFPPALPPLEPLVAARCVNGTLLRPGNAVGRTTFYGMQTERGKSAPGGVPLGRGVPGQRQSSGGLRGRNLVPPTPPPPLPPPPPPVPHASAAPSTVTYSVQWTPLHTRPKAAGGGGPPDGPPNGGGSSSQGNGHSRRSTWRTHRQEEELGQEEQLRSGGGTGPGGAGPPPPGGGHGGGSSSVPGGTPPQPTGGAGNPGSTPPTPPGLPQSQRHPDPWGPLDRSRKSLPKLMLPSNYKACSILEMRQLTRVATW